MELSGYNINKFLIFQEVTFQSRKIKKNPQRENFLYFKNRKPRKNFLYILKRKLFLYLRKWKLRKNFLYFRKRKPRKNALYFRKMNLLYRGIGIFRTLVYLELEAYSKPWYI